MSALCGELSENDKENTPSADKTPQTDLLNKFGAFSSYDFIDTGEAVAPDVAPDAVAADEADDDIGNAYAQESLQLLSLD